MIAAPTGGTPVILVSTQRTHALSRYSRLLSEISIVSSALPLLICVATEAGISAAGLLRVAPESRRGA
jgi:hypothetical protein